MTVPIDASAEILKPLVTTACIDCIFATWSGRTQHGCEFARIERFRANGGVEEKVEVDNERDIEPVKYFEIQRFCNKKRTNQWGKDHGGSEIEDLEKEVALKFTCLIHTDYRTKIEDFAKCINSIVAQTHQPTQILVIDNYSDLYDEIYEILKTLNIPWKIVKIQTELSDQGILYSNHKEILGKYFAQIMLPCVLPVDFIEQLDIGLNIRMERFVTVKYKTLPNVEVFQTFLIKQFFTHLIHEVDTDNEYVDCNDIIDIIKVMAKKHNQKYMVANW